MDNNKKSAVTNVKEWPGAFAIYKVSREAVLRSLSTIIWLVVMDIAITLVLNMAFRAIFGVSFGTILTDFINIVISAFFVAALVHTYLKSIRGSRVELEEAFKAAQPFWMRMILLDLLVAVTVLGGLILLIIPGVYFGLRLYLAPYYLVDQNLTVMDAYKASWDATKGNVGKLWGIIGVYFLMILPVITIVGVLATIYLSFMYSASYALLYDYLRKKTPKSAKSEA